MKTFETEKGNIPEGATHYANETDTGCFIWYREGTGEIMVNGYTVNEWESAGKDEDLSDLEPIPSVTTETPEEKEALDAIEQGEWKDKYEVPPVGWRGLSAYTEEGGDDWCEFHDGVVMGVNGDYVWMAHHGKFQRVHHIGCIEFKEPETQEAKKEREREMAVYDMCSSIDNHAEEARFWAERFYDAGYRKGE